MVRIVVAFIALTAAGTAQQNRLIAPIGQDIVYKTVDSVPLHLYVSQPEDNAPHKRRAAVLFFHGGGWTEGSPATFNTFARDVAQGGAVAITVQYRLLPKGEALPPERCVEDAKSAIRWVRSHASQLDIDPRRIAVAGASAGGYMAAYAAVLNGWDDPGDDLRISAKPDILLLWFPVLDNSSTGYAHERFGMEAARRSPFSADPLAWPPTLVMSGGKDLLIDAHVLEKQSKRIGQQWELHIYPDAGHGFLKTEPYSTESANTMMQFLRKYCYVAGRDSVPSS